MDIRLTSRAMLTLALLAGAVRGAEVPLDANDAPAVKALISDLGASDFAARERAQKTLETIPYSQIETLRKYADAVTDAEAKARLAAVADNIEELGIMTEPPISLDVDGVTASPAGAALGKATGSPTYLTAPDNLQQTFTLHAKDQPFSEVVRLLSLQHLLFTPPGVFDVPQYVQSTRGTAVVIMQPTRTGTSVTFQVAAILDPRIKVLDIHDPEINDVRDEQGDALDLAPDNNDVLPKARILAARNAAAMAGNSLQSPSFKAFKFDGAGASGKSATIKGSVTCVIGVSETKTEIADAGKHLGEAFALGDSKVTLRNVSPAIAAGARSSLQLEIVPDDSKVAAPAAPIVKFTATGMSISGGLSAGGGTRLVIDNEGSPGGIMVGGGGPSTGATHITVTDATGKTVANYSVPRGSPVTSIHAVAGDFKEPVKFIFTVPTKTREVTIPFEFKNLPVK